MRPITVLNHEEFVSFKTEDEMLKPKTNDA